MRKSAVFLAAVALFPTVAGLQTGLEPVKDFRYNVKDVNTVNGSLVVGFKKRVSLLSASENWTRNPFGKVKGSVVARNSTVLVGTRGAGASLIGYNLKGEKKFETRLSGPIGGTRIFNTRKGETGLGSPGSSIHAYYLNGSRRFVNRGRDVRRRLTERSRDFDGDGTGEFLVAEGFRGPGKVKMLDVNGRQEWSIDQKEGFGRLRPDFRISGDSALLYSSERLSKIHLSNGSEIWSKNYSGDRPRVAATGEGFVLSNSTGLYRVSRGGETRLLNGTAGKVSRLNFLEQENLVVASREDRVEFYSLQGELEDSVRVESPRVYLKNEPYVASGKRLYRVSFDEQVFHPSRDMAAIGRGKEMLKAVSANMTAVAAEKYGEKLVEEGDVVSVNVYGPNSTGKLEFNGTKYFPGSRRKAVVVAGLAAADNATLTFKRSEADRSFADTSLQKLRGMFIERFEPNHVVVADFDTAQGVLAGRMAVHDGALPVHAETAAEADRKIENAFERIGNNRKTVFQGRYVSLLDVEPRKVEDPVDQGFFGDPGDGETLPTDVKFGNLDGDSYLEASVGRYPRKPSSASRLFMNSDRTPGGNASAYSMYRYSNWPVTLATGGGGMFTGNAAELILEREGYRTKNFVEYRAKPVELLLELVAAPKVVRKIHEKKSSWTSVIGAGGAEVAENVAVVVKGLEYAERALRILHEYQWKEYDPTEVDVPDEFSRDALDRLLDSLLPDRHPRLTGTALKRSAGESDLVFYAGKPSEGGWKLPQEEVETLPEMNSTVIFDSSGDSMASEALESGAASYAGFRGNAYHMHSSRIGLDFLKNGKTVGDSLRRAVNDLRMTRFVYSPTSALKTGVKRKMELSPVLYGNPETRKYPIREDEPDLSRECEGLRCTVSGTLQPNYTERNGSLAFNSSSVLRKSFRPEIPVYTFTRELPEGSSIEDAEVDQNFEEVNASLPVYKPLKTDGTVLNGSLEGDFPSRTVRVNASDRLEYVQAGARIRNDTTEVLESAEVSIQYERPLGVELTREGRNLSATVYSNERRELELAVRRGNSTVTRNIAVNGSRTVDLERLPRGKSRVEAAAFNHRISAESRERFEISRPVETELEAGNARVSGYSAVEFEVENTNSFPVERSFRVETGNGVMPALHEEVVKTVRLKPGNSTVSWRLIGLSQGETNVSVNGTAHSVEVEKPGFWRRISSPSGFFSLARNDVEVEKNLSPGFRLRVSTRNGEFVKVRDYSTRHTRLETPGFRVERLRTPRRRLDRFESPHGSFVRDSKGVKIRNVSRARAEKSFEKLERFSEQLPPN